MNRRITLAEAEYLGQAAWSVTVNGQMVYETNMPADPAREVAIAKGYRWNGREWVEAA